MSMRPTEPTEIAPETPASSENKGESFGLLSELRNSGGPALDGAAKPRRKFSSTTVIMLLVLAGSGGLLFGMRHIGTSGGRGAAGVQIEYTRDETVTAAMQEQVMGQLARSASPLQVPAEQLNLDTKNPFMLPITKVGSIVTAVDDPDATARAKWLAQLTARNADVQARLAEVHLQGVMQGKVPLARVDGVTVRAGDTVNEIFTVKHIGERSMTLTVDAKDFEVSMPEPGSEPASGKRPASKPAPLKTQKKK